MSKNYYKSGDWNLICDVCSSKIKASKSKHRWDGFIVCPSCYEQRHPQDFVKSRQDKITVPYIRPPTDTFIVVPYIIYIDDGYIVDGYFYSPF
jgi:hypothetical protein